MDYSSGSGGSGGGGGSSILYPGPIQPRIAIIGAGLTGLSVAHGLKKNGFSNITIFEADAHVDARPRDWTILIHWGLADLRALLPARLGVDLRDRASANPHGYNSAHPLRDTVPAFSSASGEIVFAMPAVGSMRISRQRLRRALVGEFVDPAVAGVIRWGKALEGWDVDGGDRDGDAEMTGPVTLRFRDGTTFQADYVLGADGTSSKVRELLLGRDRATAPESGLMYAHADLRYGSEAKVRAVLDMHPFAGLVFFRGSVGGFGILDACDPDDLSTWTAFWVRIWGTVHGRSSRSSSSHSMQGKEAIDYVKSITRGAWAPFQHMIDSTPEGSRCFASNMRYWIPTRWDNWGGRITLAGDAAHSMLPFRGQGFQHSIADAKLYVDTHMSIRADPSVRRAAMDRYDADLVDRGGNAVRQTLEEAEKALDPTKVPSMDMARKGLVRNA